MDLALLRKNPVDLIRASTVACDALANGFQVCTHAIGDRANREVLKQYARSFAENPEKSKDHLH